MLSTQEMQNIAMVLEIELILHVRPPLLKATHKSTSSYTYRNFETAHNKLFFKETTC